MKTIILAGHLANLKLMVNYLLDHYNDFSVNSGNASIEFDHVISDNKMDHILNSLGETGDRDKVTVLTKER